MANAAYFGLPKPTTSIQTALRHVGFGLLRFLALSSTLFARIDSSLLESKTLRDLPLRSVLKAQLARELVSDRTRADKAFAAGLLLDIGIIVLAQGRVESYVEILTSAESESRPLHEIEREQLGYSHAEAGAYLLGLWGLPPKLVEVVASHHRPEWPTAPDDSLGVAVHVADVLVDSLRAGRQDPLEGFAPAFRGRSDVSPFLPGWVERAREVVKS